MLKLAITPPGSKGIPGFDKLGRPVTLDSVKDEDGVVNYGKQKHVATIWLVATDPSFKEEFLVKEACYFGPEDDTLEEGRGDDKNLLVKVFDVKLDPNKKYYASAMVRMEPGGWQRPVNSELFIPQEANSLSDSAEVPSKVSIPLLASSCPFTCHGRSYFTLNVDGYYVVGTASHTSTSWFIHDDAGVVLWHRHQDEINKSKILVNDLVLEDNKIYFLRAMFHSSTGDASQLVSYPILIKNTPDIIINESLSAINNNDPFKISILTEEGFTKVEWEIISISDKIHECVFRATTEDPEIIVPVNTLVAGVLYYLKVRTDKSEGWRYEDMAGYSLSYNPDTPVYKPSTPVLPEDENVDWEDSKDFLPTPPVTDKPPREEIEEEEEVEIEQPEDTKEEPKEDENLIEEPTILFAEYTDEEHNPGVIKFTKPKLTKGDDEIYAVEAEISKHSTFPKEEKYQELRVTKVPQDVHKLEFDVDDNIVESVLPKEEGAKREPLFVRMRFIGYSGKTLAYWSKVALLRFKSKDTILDIEPDPEIEEEEPLPPTEQPAPEPETPPVEEQQPEETPKEEEVTPPVEEEPAPEPEPEPEIYKPEILKIEVNDSTVPFHATFTVSNFAINKEGLDKLLQTDIEIGEDRSYSFQAGEELKIPLTTDDVGKIYNARVKHKGDKAESEWSVIKEFEVVDRREVATPTLTCDTVDDPKLKEYDFTSSKFAITLSSATLAKVKYQISLVEDFSNILKEGELEPNIENQYKVTLEDNVQLKQGPIYLRAKYLSTDNIKSNWSNKLKYTVGGIDKPKILVPLDKEQILENFNIKITEMVTNSDKITCSNTEVKFSVAATGDLKDKITKDGEVNVIENYDVAKLTPNIYNIEARYVSTEFVSEWSDPVKVFLGRTIKAPVINLPLTDNHVDNPATITIGNVELYDGAIEVTVEKVIVEISNKQDFSNILTKKELTVAEDKSVTGSVPFEVADIDNIENKFYIRAKFLGTTDGVSVTSDYAIKEFSMAYITEPSLDAKQ